MLTNLLARMRYPAVGLGLLWSLSANAELRLNMPEGVTAISHQVYSLHMTILLI